MHPQLVRLALLLGLVGVCASPVRATLYADLGESCAAFVHIESQQTTVDDDNSRAMHSLYSARVIDSDGCATKPTGTIQFVAPGGRVGEHASMVNAIDIAPGRDIVVHLSQKVSFGGIPFVLRTSNTAELHGQRGFQCSRAGSDGPSLFWKTRRVQMRPSFPPDSTLNGKLLLEAMTWAAAAWSNVQGSDFAFEIGSPVQQRWVGFDWSNQRPNYNIVTVRESTKHDFFGEWIHAAGVLALTHVTYVQKTGEIVDADIEINLEHFSFDDCAREPKSCRYSFDLSNTLTHEFGHALGLDHPDESLHKATQTTMYAKSLVGEISKRWLSPDDMLGLIFLYPSGKQSQDCFGIPKASPKTYHIVQDPGCSQGDSPPVWLALLLVMAALLRRWRVIR